MIDTGLKIEDVKAEPARKSLEEREAERKALFDRVMKADLAPSGDEKLGVEAEKGKEAPAKAAKAPEKPAETPAGEPEEAAPGAQEAQKRPAEAGAGEDDANYVIALSALQRSGFTMKEIDGMGREEVLKRGLDRHTYITRNEETYRRLKEAELAKETPRKEEKPESSEPSGEPLDFRTAVAPLVEALELEEEAAGRLEKGLQGLLSPVLKRLEAAEGSLRARDAREGEGLVLETRRRVGDRFPGLLDAATFERVKTRMDLLAKDEHYRGLGTMDQALQALMRDAARSIGLEESDPEERATSEAEERQIRSAAVPTASSQRGARPKYTPSQERRVIFNWLQSHPGDVEGARKAAGLT